MQSITAAIEQSFYSAIQWSLKHQGQAILLLLIAALIPLGMLNFLQYQAMVKYEQAGTQAMHEQLHYILGRLALSSYNNLLSQAGQVFHQRNARHQEFFSTHPQSVRQQEIQTTLDGMQVMSKKCERSCNEYPRQTDFVLLEDHEWMPHFATGFKPAPPIVVTIARARLYFLSLDPIGRDVGFIFFYDPATELSILMHPISPEPIAEKNVEPPLRPIVAVMGIAINRQTIKEILLNNNFNRNSWQSNRYSAPIDSALGKANYYFQIKDDRGRVVHEDAQWVHDSRAESYIRDSFVIEPEQKFLTGWKISAMTRSGLRQATSRSLQQMFLASGVVAVLLCLLLVILLRAGLAAVKVSKMQSDIVAGVSHDLKTPLAGILASAQLIASGRANNPQDIKEFAGYIMAEAKRLTAVVEKVLTMAKLESRQLLMRPIMVRISTLVDEAIESVRGAFPKATILKGEIPDDEIQADVQALTTVLVNLIDNAVRYSEDPPEVLVHARWTSASDRRVLHLIVQDRGVGIPVEEQPLIFEKFYRIRRGLVNDTDGTGLGLAIASEIVRAHHGQIQVESQVGSGSTFTVVIPHEQPDFSG